MRDLPFLIAAFLLFGVSLLSSAAPAIARFLVRSASAKGVLIIAIILCGAAVVRACAGPITPRSAMLIAAGIAPLHQLLLLHFLHRRFVERHGREPGFVKRGSPPADANFAINNILLGAFPYAVLGLFLLGRAR